MVVVGGVGGGGAVVTSDLDFDGTDNTGSGGIDNDLFLESYDANAGLRGKNHVSSPSVANRLGYAGYEWDDVLKAAHVRHRVYFPDIGRWSRRDPVGYAEGMDLYEYAAGEPITSLDPLGLDAGWARRPGNDPWGEYLGCGLDATLEWHGSWTLAERARLRLAIERAKHRAMNLINQINIINTSLSSCVFTELVPELNELQRRMKDFVALLDDQSKIIKVYQNNLGNNNEALTKSYRYFGMINANCELNNSPSPSDPNWLRMTLGQLAARMLHELSRIMEGPTDYDGTGKLYDLHNINTPDGYFYKDIADTAAYRVLLGAAKAKCKENKNECDTRSK